MKHRIKETIFVMVIVFVCLLSLNINSLAATNSSTTQSAQIIEKNIDIKGNVLTTADSETLTYVPDDEYDILIRCSHGDYGAVSELTHFFDYKGLYNIVYQNNNYLYFDRYTTSLKKVSTIKVKMKYPLFGDAIQDDNGNYYIVWGKEDTSLNGGIVTMAVSKYDYSGNHIKTTGYKTTGGRESWDTRIPFDAGNCDTIIDKNGMLVCSYGREMYNGHQSNDILCIDTETMKKHDEYSNYASHSFDQRIINLSDGGVCIVNKGDGYPRAFGVDFYNTTKKSGEYFHFYGSLGNNYVYAWLGGVVESGKNVYLVGSSAKSMTSKAETETQNLFVQLLDPDKELNGSVTRKGTSNDETVVDKNIKWLTNYSSKYTVANPQVVSIGKNNFVIMWEKIKINDYDKEFVQSYYCILDSNGYVIQTATPMNGVRLTSHEDPVYRAGYIYWTTAGSIEEATIQTSSNSYYLGYKVANGNKGVIHKLKVEKSLSDANSNFTGLYKCQGNWYYVKKGAVDFSYTGLCKRGDIWYYVEDGRVDFTYTGLCKRGDIWYYVKNGRVDFTYTGLCKRGDIWYYVKNGRLNWDYTGLCKRNETYYYVKNGRVDFTYTGLCKRGDIWYYVKNGRLNWDYTGLCKRNETYYYVEDGRVDFTYTGLCKHGGKWYYIENGRLNWGFSGDVEYNGKTYKVVNGVKV